MNEEEITERIGKVFRTFGGGNLAGAEWNPLVSWLKDKPLMFASGVDVRQVVHAVLLLSKRKKRRGSPSGSTR